MRFPLFREKAWQKAFPNLGSNRREVTLKFDLSNFSLLFVSVLQQFRTQPKSLTKSYSLFKLK